MVRQNSFFIRQITQIAKGGLPVFIRKARILASNLLTLFLMPFALLAVLIVRMLRPLVTIRFIALSNSRIGHFIGNTEVHLCETEMAKKPGQRIIDVFYYFSPDTCNKQLKKMWERTICVFWFAKLLDKVNRKLPGGKAHIVEWRELSDRDIHNLLIYKKPYLSFTSQEENFGSQELRRIGIAQGSPFICLHARDSAYLNSIDPAKDWYYQKFRDLDIKNFILSAEEMALRGYFVVRMGAVVNEKLETNNPKIIDYATKFRTDFLDIFLCAKCRFFLGSDTGLNKMSQSFRRPTIAVDCAQLEYVISWMPNYLFIPRKFWLRREKRFMTFHEIIDSGVGRFFKTQEFENYGIDLISNTPEEIRNVAVEMDDRLNGLWQETKEDKELQQRFWSVFQNSKLHGKTVSKIGADFLRQNSNLLN